ncbi:YaaL family protein [Paenibacillus hodogayensis]|uniref:YaaL family protein n=1 Tax=Paenibacillus hodogayensis TaxID=279208 RepID=A0ABV5W1C1_9BACL
MLWRLFGIKPQAADPYWKDKQELLQEIRVAQTDWQHALYRLDYAADQDQIDYAIFALEAAEKRYEMLLRSAKKLNVHALHAGMGRTAEG